MSVTTTRFAPPSAARAARGLDACANDLDLMAEEYDDGQDRMAGNFPQAFSHLALLRAADALAQVRAADGAGEAGD